MSDFFIEYVLPVFITILLIFVSILVFAACKLIIENDFNLNTSSTCKIEVQNDKDF